MVKWRKYLEGNILAIVSGIIAVLTSGAGGGIVGGLLGIFKQSQERKERVEMARINLERDQAEYANAKAEREHSLLLIEKQGEQKAQQALIELEKTQTETEAEIEISNQNALHSAQEVFNNLKTSSAMDNFRASVRPVLAYFVTVFFSAIFIWAFWEFKGTIDENAGRELLLGMFATLTFAYTSVKAFYFVSRRNSAPRV